MRDVYQLSLPLGVPPPHEGGLVVCYVAADYAPTFAAALLRLSSLYQHLSGFIHNTADLQTSGSAIDIVEGPVSQEQMQVLACIAKELQVPVKLVKRSAAASSSFPADSSGEGMQA